MSTPRDRNPTIQDGLILVAATAIGLAAIRGIHGWYFDGPFHWSGDRGHLTTVLFSSSGFLMASWTTATLAIRLMRPRPSMSRLARQPGFAACSAAVLGMSVVALFALAIPSLSRIPGPPIIGMIWIAVPSIGTAVAVAWLGLMLGKRWRPVPSWIDRIGRAIGAIWLLGLGLFWWSLASGIVNFARVW